MEYKKNNPNLTTTEIGNIMKLYKTTVIRYLKKGNELNWCHYNADEEAFKGRSNGGKSKGKIVEIFNQNNILLGIFSSCAELEKQSEKLYEIKLCGGSVSLICLGKQKQVKGYTIKYK